jgi:hypothetical protein
LTAKKTSPYLSGIMDIDASIHDKENGDIEVSIPDWSNCIIEASIPDCYNIYIAASIPDCYNGCIEDRYNSHT